MSVLWCRDRLLGGIGVRCRLGGDHGGILRQGEGAGMVEEDDIRLRGEVGREGIEVVVAVVGDIEADMVGDLEMEGVIVIVQGRDHEVRTGIQGEIEAEGGDEVPVTAAFQVGVRLLLREGEVAPGVEVRCQEGGEIGV